MHRRTEGIVLGTTPVAEADLIVKFLTLNHGLIRTYAKSPRKSKSRFGASLEPLTYSLVAFWGREDSRLPRLTQSDIIEPFQSLREDLHTFMNAGEMLRLTADLLPEAEPNKKAFFLLRTTLRTMQTLPQNTVPYLALLYRIKLLDIAGYSPSLTGCAKCGKLAYSFYIPPGSILCKECVKGRLSSAPAISAGGVRLFENMRRWDIPQAMRIKPTRNMHLEVKNLLDAHIRSVLGECDYNGAVPFASRIKAPSG